MRSALSAEGFEWQKIMVRVRTPRCGGRFRVSQDHHADVQFLGVHWAAGTLHNVSMGMMRLMLLPELVTTCLVAAPISTHTHTHFFFGHRLTSAAKSTRAHTHTDTQMGVTTRAIVMRCNSRTINNFNKVCMPLFRPRPEGFEP